MDPVADLVDSWRDDADVLERHGRAKQAERLRLRAEEVEDAMRRRRRELLTIAEASDHGGFAEKTLRRRCREGTIEGADKVGGEWRIPRETCPRKGRPPGNHDGDRDAVERHLDRVDMT